MSSQMAQILCFLFRGILWTRSDFVDYLDIQTKNCLKLNHQKKILEINEGKTFIWLHLIREIMSEKEVKVR